MLSAILSFVSQHRRKFICSGVVIGGIVFLTRYERERLMNGEPGDNTRLLWQLKRRHFTIIQEVCSETLLYSMVNVKSVILEQLSSTKLVSSLKNKTAANKIAVWKEIQVSSCAKLISFIYASSVLFVFMKIQFNLYGGHEFVNARNHLNRIDSHTKGTYMELRDHFMYEGVVQLCEFVKKKVEIAMTDKSLAQGMSFEDVKNLFKEIITSILNDKENPCKNLGSYLFPDKYKDDTLLTKSHFLHQLIFDTKDVLEDNITTENILSCMVSGFDFICMELGQFYWNYEGNKTKSNLSESMVKYDIHNTNIDPSVSVPMAKIIPFIDNLITRDGNDPGRAWLTTLTVLTHMQVLGASVFETFSSKW